MFFGFQLTLGLMMVFYGYSVMKNPRVWGDQGRRAVKPEHFEEYCRQNGLFFLKAGCVVAVIGALDALITLDALLYALLYLFGLAFAFYPLVKWCRENEGFSWPWPHVKSEKKRIKELRKSHDLTQKEISDILFCSQQVYCNYELGQRDLPTSVLIDMANYYSVSIDYILGQTSNPKRNT